MAQMDSTEFLVFGFAVVAIIALGALFWLYRRGRTGRSADRVARDGRDDVDVQAPGLTAILRNSDTFSRGEGTMNHGEAEAIWRTLKGIGEVVGQAQAFHRMSSYILVEVVSDLAKMTPDPRKYLSDMFERVSARADQGTTEKETHPATAEFHDAIARFFSLAEKRSSGRG